MRKCLSLATRLTFLLGCYWVLQFCPSGVDKCQTNTNVILAIVGLICAQKGLKLCESMDYVLKFIGRYLNGSCEDVSVRF